MRMIVIDGQGVGIGRSLVEKLRAELPDAELAAVWAWPKRPAWAMPGGGAYVREFCGGG